MSFLTFHDENSESKNGEKNGDKKNKQPFLSFRDRTRNEAPHNIMLQEKQEDGGLVTAIALFSGKGESCGGYQKKDM